MRNYQEENKTLRERIERIDEYIVKASALEGRVSGDENRFIVGAQEILSNSRKLLEAMIIYNGAEERYERKKELMVNRDVEYVTGNKDKSIRRLEVDLRKQVKYFAKGIAYKALSYLARPFSKDHSAEFDVKAKEYFEDSKGVGKGIHMKKQIEEYKKREAKSEQESIDVIKEVLRSSQIQSNESVPEYIAKHPEILSMVAIDAIERKLAK